MKDNTNNNDVESVIEALKMMEERVKYLEAKNLKLEQESKESLEESFKRSKEMDNLLEKERNEHAYEIEKVNKENELKNQDFEHKFRRHEQQKDRVHENQLRELDNANRVLMQDNRELQQQSQIYQQQGQALYQQNQGLQQENQALYQQNQSLQQENQTLYQIVEEKDKTIQLMQNNMNLQDRKNEEQVRFYDNQNRESQDSLRHSEQSAENQKIELAKKDEQIAKLQEDLKTHMVKDINNLPLEDRQRVAKEAEKLTPEKTNEIIENSNDGKKKNGVEAVIVRGIKQLLKATPVGTIGYFAKRTLIDHRNVLGSLKAAIIESTIPGQIAKYAINKHRLKKQEAKKNPTPESVANPAQKEKFVDKIKNKFRKKSQGQSQSR